MIITPRIWKQIRKKLRIWIRVQGGYFWWKNGGGKSHATVPLRSLYINECSVSLVCLQVLYANGYVVSGNIVYCLMQCWGDTTVPVYIRTSECSARLILCLWRVLSCKSSVTLCALCPKYNGASDFVCLWQWFGLRRLCVAECGVPLNMVSPWKYGLSAVVWCMKYDFDVVRLCMWYFCKWCAFICDMCLWIWRPGLCGWWVRENCACLLTLCVCLNGFPLTGRHC
jgi:hypothetical protein